MKKIHVVAHSHWDREWYFTTSRSKIYLMKDMQDVLTTLEEQPEFKYYLLDAQASLIDDYLKWRPQDETRIRVLVQSGRLLIGPWYTQTDQLLISAESITRNLYYGIYRCRDFGQAMMVGYVPDSFGQSAQMPQIYQEFGIEDTLFWRGVSKEMSEKTEFIWEGSDGARVNAYQIPFGYYIGGNIPENDVELKAFLSRELKRISERASTDVLYFPNGFDQAPIRRNLPNLIERANALDEDNHYCISSPQAYIAEVKQHKPERDILRGELICGKEMRIHKSIFSSRSDLKIWNTKIQNYVTNILEPLLTLSYSLGNDYPHEVVKDIWKLLFENAAHDSIGSCVSDTTNEDVYFRYKQARDLSLNLVEIHSRYIATGIKMNQEEMTITLINTLPISRSGVLSAELYLPDEQFVLLDSQGRVLPYVIEEQTEVTEYILAQTIQLDPSRKIYMPMKIFKAKILLEVNDAPALGYEQLLVCRGQAGQSLLRTDGVPKIANERYEISIASNGSLDILERCSGRIYRQQAVLEESGDDGDSFNYSPPRANMEIHSLDVQAEIHCIRSSLHEKAVISYEMKIPYDLQERSEGITRVSMPVKLEVTLMKGSMTIGFGIKVDNQALSHRLRIVFDTGIASKFSIADQQFGLIRRPVLREKELVSWENDTAAWQEKPISIEPMQTFVALADEVHGAAIIPHGVREYEIIGDAFSAIALTLFRSYGYMGKENLLYRPGRASGEKIIATPDAQLIGALGFSFDYYLFCEKFEQAKVANTAKKCLTPLQYYEYAEFLNGRLIFSLAESVKNKEKRYSLFELFDDTLTVSAIKKAEKEDGIILRLYHANGEHLLDESILLNPHWKKAEYRYLDESIHPDGKLVRCDEKFIVKNVAPCKVKTIYFQ